jgi:hypothetical protein
MSKFVQTALIAISAAGFVAHGSATASQTKPAANDNTVRVTVKYNGKGTVDAMHRLWVWIFAEPDIGANSIPIGEQSLDKNGGTVTFSTGSDKPVYVAVAYDEGGGFAGQSPPPPGSPIGMYGAKGPKDGPEPVTPGPKTTVTVSFDDTQRMQ